jgi:hypothetical protein
MIQIFIATLHQLISEVSSLHRVFCLTYGMLHAYTMCNRAKWAWRRRSVAKSDAAVWVEPEQAVALYVQSGNAASVSLCTSSTCIKLPYCYTLLLYDRC